MQHIYFDLNSWTCLIKTCIYGESIPPSSFPSNAWDVGTRDAGAIAPSICQNLYSNQGTKLYRSHWILKPSYGTPERTKPLRVVFSWMTFGITSKQLKSSYWATKRGQNFFEIVTFVLARQKFLYSQKCLNKSRQIIGIWKYKCIFRKDFNPFGFLSDPYCLDYSLLNKTENQSLKNWASNFLQEILIKQHATFHKLTSIIKLLVSSNYLRKKDWAIRKSSIKIRKLNPIFVYLP